MTSERAPRLLRLWSVWLRSERGKHDNGYGIEDPSKAVHTAKYRDRMTDETRRHPAEHELRAFFDSQPKVLAGAGVLMRHHDGRILLVKPTYRDGWQFPGGGLNANESPRRAARRETHEELGIDLEPGRLLGVSFRPDSGRIPEMVHFVFDGGSHDDELFTSIKLDDFELAEWELVDRRDAITRVRSAQRMRALLQALDDGGTAYLEGH